jgi:hypothetical protein
MSLPRRYRWIVHLKNGIPSSLPRDNQEAIDHVQAPCNWSADFSIGTACAVAPEAAS